MPSAPMQRALELAPQAGYVSPNPAVGCVIVKDGQVVGEGYYAGPDSPHAEVAALRAAGDAARGATVYVTLEPCRHDVSSTTGQPRLSCSRALIEAGVGRVVLSVIDPDPRTAGAGKASLEAAGIAVEVGDGAPEATKLMEAFLKHRSTGLPFVIVKYAASLDGRISAGSGDSRWVSGPETLRWAHANRPNLDAIMVGSSTVVIDDPQLTARPDGVLSAHQPLRVVLDSTGRIPATASVLQGESKTLIATTDRSSEQWRHDIEATGTELLVLPAGQDARVPLRSLLEELGRRGVLTLLVEGGGVLHGSFFSQRLVDKVTAVIAPLIVGEGATAVDGTGIQRMADAVRLHDITVDRLGDDILVTAYPVLPAEI